MRVKVYDEKTGDPWLDNRARARNRAVNRVCRRRRFRIETPRGRKRVHYLMGQEFPRYVRLVALVTDELRKRKA